MKKIQIIEDQNKSERKIIASLQPVGMERIRILNIRGELMPGLGELNDMFGKKSPRPLVKPVRQPELEAPIGPPRPMVAPVTEPESTGLEVYQEYPNTQFKSVAEAKEDANQANKLVRPSVGDIIGGVD